VLGGVGSLEPLLDELVSVVVVGVVGVEVEVVCSVTIVGVVSTGDVVSEVSVVSVPVTLEDREITEGCPRLSSIVS
tara:strand:- start:6 stop:233 length:228 start_codon:yes stop_codon:yes gene_type:complete